MELHSEKGKEKFALLLWSSFRGLRLEPGTSCVLPFLIITKTL